MNPVWLLVAIWVPAGVEGGVFALDMARNAMHSLYKGFDCDLRWPLDVKLSWKGRGIFKVPNGVQWNWEGFGVCKRFDSELAIADWKAEFGCWGPLLDFAWNLKDSVADLEELDAGTASKITSDLINAVVANQVCLASECTAPGGGIKAPGPIGRVLKHFCLRTKQAERQAKLKADHAAAGNILMQLPPIDNELYANFVARMAYCYGSGGTACRQLSLKLKEYMKDSLSSLVGGFVELKNRLVWYVTEPLNEFVSIVSDLDGVIAGLKTCKTKANDANAARDFESAVESAEAKKDLAQNLKAAAETLNKTIEFGQELREIYNMTKTLDAKKPSLAYIKKVAEIPHTIADLIEAFRNLRELPGQILAAVAAGQSLDDILNSDMPVVARSVQPVQAQSNSQCKAALTKLKNFGVAGLGAAWKAFDIKGVFGRIKQLTKLQLDFDVGAPVFHNYLSFKWRENVRLPKITWTDQCMNKWVKAISWTSPAFAIAMAIAKKRSDFCIKRPKIEWNEGRMFPDVRILPGFLPYLAIKMNIKIPPAGTPIN